MYTFLSFNICSILLYVELLLLYSRGRVAETMICRFVKLHLPVTCCRCFSGLMNCKTGPGDSIILDWVGPQTGVAKCIVWSDYIENKVWTRVANCLCTHDRVILVLFPDLRSNEGNKHQNKTRVSAYTVRHKSTHIILFLTRHNESINDAKTRMFTHNPHVSVARITFCWWRHNR